MRLRSLFLAAFLLVFSVAAIQAQKPQPAVVDSPLVKSLLWEIKGKGIKKSYLFGTIHIIPAKDFLLSETTLKKLKKTKQLVLEMDMSNPMAMAVQMMMLAPMKDNQKLSDLLSKEDYDVVKKYFEGRNSMGMMPFETLETWKPMLVQSMLYQDGISMMGEATKSYEMELISLSQERKMAFGGLEEIADQMNIFEQIPYKDQALDLVESIKELQSGGNDVQTEDTEMMRVVALYKAQDIEGMVQMTNVEYTDIENAAEILLNQRNRKWITKIGEFAAKQPTFFAVGAGHLGGASGVIKLLTKEGYSVTPIW